MPAKRTKAKAKGKAKANGNPKCGALKADNKKCKNYAAGTGKYCAQHKGWRPNAAQKKILAR